MPTFHPDLKKARFLPRSLMGPRSLPLIRWLSARALRRGAAIAQSMTVSASASVRLFGWQRVNPANPTPAVLWIHGGGLIMGNAVQDHLYCEQVANELGVAVASVEYRLAPEDPFPAGLDDCFAALHWLAAQPGIDPARIAVAGGSAGGNLAAALAVRARDEGGVKPCFQLLLYPMLDDRTVLRSDLDRSSMRMWSPKANQFGWNSYLMGKAGGVAVPALAAPARAEDLSGLPPAWIGVGGSDLFHDEDVAYALRLQEAGVECALDVVPGGYHAFDVIEGSAPVSQRFIAAQIAAPRGGLGLYPQ